MILLIFCKDKSTQRVQLSPKFIYQDDKLRRKCSSGELYDKCKITAQSICTPNNYFGHNLIDD